MLSRKLVVILCFLFTAGAHASDWANYRLTLTNATAHQVITPPLIVVHHTDFSLFSVGTVASAGLVTLAETGNNSELNADISGAHGVITTIAANAVIPPGQHASFDFHAPRRAHLSLAGMLATTNDGFAGLNDVALPKHGSTRYYAYAYDAGAEMNNESCAYVPGPPCPPDSGNLTTAHGEGFISIHSGIHGGGDLDPRQLDWHGPEAIVTIERILN